MKNGREADTGGTGRDLSKRGGYKPLDGVSPAIKGLHAAAYFAAHPEESANPDYDDSDEDWTEDDDPDDTTSGGTGG